mmetsp:Transcript_6234/g.22157  ORF Transcript_6234/g.22157 Transcript_6234/m.22157 type:complete len:195 (-) Transcript_6234:1053-1637(-)
MIVVNGFMVHTLKHRIRRRGFFHYYGPLLCTLIAAPLIMADLTRHVLSDWNVWQWCGNNTDFPRINQTWDEAAAAGDACRWSSTMYRCDVPCCVPGTWDGQPAGTYPTLPLSPGEECTCDVCMSPGGEKMANLSMIGYLFTIGFTYSGFTMLALGTLWNASIIKKLKEIGRKYRELRAGGAPIRSSSKARVTSV